ncbi:MAG TPA: discoidin domain-containing protein, partial [Flavisolibacter sp.]|nr:discoidin domain-containing protein [Flavisolibacter sp.]
EDAQWKTIAAATSIGANRLLRLPQNVTTNRLRLRITGAHASPALSDFGLFKEPPHLTPPVIHRSKEGLVQIMATAPVEAIRYTTDGIEPSPLSPRYSEAFHLPEGGTVKAKSFEEKGLSSSVTTKTFGLTKQDWKLSGENNTNLAARLMDEDPQTFYLSSSTHADSAKQVMIDLGKMYAIKGFTYLPRQDKKTEGTVYNYIFYTSNDAVNWTKVGEGEFSNIAANPVEQVIRLAAPVEVRYLKFSARSLLAGNKIAIAELGVLLK